MSGDVELAVIFKGVETDAAFLIIDPASGEEMWIPFSQTSGRAAKKNAAGKLEGEGTMTITEWMARKKGLVE